MTIMEKKEQEKRVAFFGDSINRPWTVEEKKERREFYARSGIVLKFSDRLVEVEESDKEE